MDLNIETAYTSCGCNRIPHAADWSKNGLICYGSRNSVVIYDPVWGNNGGKILETLHGHKDRVNCVRWLKNNLQSHENIIVSASSDGTAILWTRTEKKQRKIYEQSMVLKGHTTIVSIAEGFVKRPSNHFHSSANAPIYIATSSLDSNVMIWEAADSKGKPDCIDILKWPAGFCLDVKISMFPETDILLIACSADDNNVHIFVEHKKSEIDKINVDHRFYKIHVLTGHEDWVRSMDIFVTGKDLYLATGSQDTFIRVYKFERRQDLKSELVNSSLHSNNLIEIDNRIISIGSAFNEYTFSITLETILAGHEGWVYGVSWHPLSPSITHETSMDQIQESNGSSQGNFLKLLSSSLDKTMIIWSPDNSGIWTEEARVGEVGGNMLGFYGGKFGPGGKSIMGHGYQGSFHIWSLNESTASWEPRVVVGGHTSEVTDLAWDPKGNFVLSVGRDQTTRLHAPWIRKDEKKTVSWHEIARPQIHGYDLTCLAMLSQYKFASGAEEKIIRAFSAPNNFIDNFKRITGFKEDLLSGLEPKSETQPLGASVPALGLSNKPVFDQMKKEGFLVDDEYPDLYFSPIYLSEPPTEENLMQNTLWPEVQKLYGHGFDIYSLAARQDGVVLASACKANSPDHAAIILWNGKTWLQIQKLVGHQLTVTQMSFSPDGKYLLSVSRDRTWCLFGMREDGKTYELVANSDAKDGFHSRVIWCCAWTPDSLNFATGSRDGKIGIWAFTESFENEIRKLVVNSVAHVELPKESVTALAFSPIMWNGFHLLAVGLENGLILLYKYLNNSVMPLNLSHTEMRHDLAVKRLAFSPKLGAGINTEDNDSNKKILQLASCGCDHVVKIHNLFWYT